MDQLMQDIRFAARSLMKTPLVSALCVLCLAVGIGLNSNIYGAVFMAFQRPLPYASPERLVTVRERQIKTGQLGGIGYQKFFDLSQKSSAFEQMGATTFRSISITDGEEPIRLQGEMVSWTLFPMLGITPALGRNMRPDDDVPGAPPVILLGYGVWETRYALDSTIIGRSISINGSPRTVIGIMPKGFKFPEMQEAWIPLVPSLGNRANDPWDLQVFARLKPNVTFDQANAQLATLSDELAKLRPEQLGEWRSAVTPLRDEFIDPDTRLSIAAMMGAVTFVLLIACANVANLLLARATGMSREIAVRSALGAGRGRIVRQLLTESVLLAMVATPFGILLANWLMDVILASIPPNDMPYYFVFEINTQVMIYTVIVAALTGVVFGLAPALQAVRGDLQSTLRDGGRGAGTSGGRQRVRTAFAVAEVALSMVLLVGAALFGKSFLNLQARTGGIESEKLMTMRVYLPGPRYDSASSVTQRIEDIVRRVEALPGVASATASNQIPLSGGGSAGRVEIEGKPSANPAEAPFVWWNGATAHWFQALGVQIIKGRGLTEQESRTKTDVAVINETMANRFWPNDEAVGRRFRINGANSPWFTVVGVSRDYRTGGIDDIEPIRPAYLVSYNYLTARNTAVIIRTNNDPAQITSAARNAIRESDPTLPVFDIQTMTKIRADGIWSQRLFGWLFSLFGIVALVLASVGVYGVIAYGVSQRTQEIGVRVALGAQGGDVIRLILRGGAILAFTGIGIGLVGSFGVTRVIQSLLVDVSASDPTVFIGVTLFLTMVALLASYIPARRATRVDPLTALRAE